MDQVKRTWVLLGAFTLVLFAVSLVSQRLSPRELRDPRLSVHLSGPHGAAGLADALQRFGIPVVEWTRPISRMSLEGVAAGDWLALLGLGGGGGGGGGDALREGDVMAALDWLERGAAIVIAGRSRVASCLGWRVVSTGRLVTMRDARLPKSRARIEWNTRKARRTEDREKRTAVDRRCDELRMGKADTILQNDSGAPVVALGSLEGGGRVLVIADASYLTNETLRETQAGEVLLPLLLAERPTRLVVDEYDHGFGTHPSLFGATWAWVWRTPAGWAMLHLSLAGLVGLVVIGIRFGPALSVIERRRRSSLEHLDALAVGLERATASETAVELIAGGLQRRLGRLGVRRRANVGTREWLDALALSARTPRAKAAVGRLAESFSNRGDQDRVLTAAHAVEDVWEALRPEISSKTS